jgi:ABC-2 type transport system ATP-binding protein
MNPIIELRSVSHSFVAGQNVLNNVCLQIPKGSIYGLLGRNGAGKTTCIRLLVGLLKPREGSVKLLQEDPLLWKSSVSQRLGYMGESGFLPENMTGKRLISWTKKLYPQWDEALERRLIEIFQLNLLCRISSLSLGQQRQLALVLAVAFRPAVLILDEPAANLDVVARRQFLEEIAALARESETTVLFSSHILSDVERVADRVGILSNGSLLLDEPLDDLKAGIRQVRFFWDRPAPPPVQIRAAYRYREGHGETLVTLRCTDAATLQKIATATGCSWEACGLNLEDLFVEITGEK